MGVDVQMYAEGDVTDDELAAANSFMLARCSIVDTFDGRYPPLARSEDGEYDRPRIALSTMNRYYGEGYERGDWPSIYGAVRLMQTALPNCRVFYGGDSYDEGVECTDEYLAKLWAHFLGPDGDGYRERARAWNQRARLTNGPANAIV